MTHNTRERIEEIITDYYDKFPECPQDLVGCTLNQDEVDEFNRARERGEKWLRITLHQQLQKAREGERLKVIAEMESLKDIDIPDTKPICIKTLNFCIEMLKPDTKLNQPINSIFKE